MEIQITGRNKRSINLVEVTHPGELELSFDAKGYASTTPAAVKPDPDSETGYSIALFEEINEFIKRMPKEKQAALYECYARQYSIFTSFGEPMSGTGNSINDLFTYTSDVVRSIYEIVRLEDLRSYIVGNTKLKLPPELTDGYVTTDKITPLYMERTYRLHEYIDLVAFAMASRFMIPIWGKYLPIVGKEIGVDMKEFHSWKLLEGSRLYTDTLDDRDNVINRLERYIRANLDEGVYDLAIAFKHLSSDEVPTYLMALAVIRKLSVAPLSAEISSDHLMKIIHNYATGNAERLPSAMGGHIRTKTDPDGGSSEDNSSVLCIYKMKEPMSAGDLVINEVYIEKYIKAALAMDPTIDVKRVELHVKHMLKVREFHPTTGQTAIAMWVSSMVLAAIVVDMFTGDHPLIVFGITQAVLEHWDLPHLAILATAKAIELEEDESIPPPIKSPLSQEHQDMLNVINPYSLPEPKRGDAVASPNSAIRGIELVADSFYRHDWEPRCDKSLAAKYGRSNITQVVEVSRTIRTELATLLIRLNQHDRS